MPALPHCALVSITTSLPTCSGQPHVSCPHCRHVLLHAHIPSLHSHCPLTSLVPCYIPSPWPLFPISSHSHTTYSFSHTVVQSIPLCMQFSPHSMYLAIPHLFRPSPQHPVTACHHSSTPRPIPTMPPCCPCVLAPSCRFPSMCPAIFHHIYSSHPCLGHAPCPAVPFHSGCAPQLACPSERALRPPTILPPVHRPSSHLKKSGMLSCPM